VSNRGLIGKTELVEQKPDEDALTPRVRAAGRAVGSMNLLLDKTGRTGLPRRATIAVAIAWLLAFAFAVIAYVANGSWLAVGTFLGIAFLITVGVANAESLMRRE
jgi:hypothetical protein